MNERLQARVDKIEAEIARREAALTTSERQAARITGHGRSGRAERDDADAEAELARGRKLTTSERQAAYVLRANRYLEAALDAEDEDEDDTRYAEDRFDTREHGVYGVDDERAELPGDSTSRRQSARTAQRRRAARAAEEAGPPA